jgi:tetratricopeptide (TPR) repeat protein
LTSISKNLKIGMFMKTKVFDKVIQVLISLIVFLLPLIFIPFFTEVYGFGKQIFLLVSSFILFCLWMAKSFLEKKLVTKKSSYLSLIILIFLAFLASTLLNSPNKLQSFAAFNGPGSIFILLITFYLIFNLGKEKAILYSLLASGAALSIIRIALFLGSFSYPIVLPSLNVNITKAWSPTGSLLAHAAFLLTLIPLGFGAIYNGLREKRMTTAVLAFIINVLNMVGLGMSFYLLGTEAKPVLLPQGVAWVIAVESLKNSRLALFGLAPGQFINAFTSFKPLGFNGSEYWNLRFGSSSNWYFQLLNEVGIIGLVLYAFLVWKIFKNSVKVLRHPKASSTSLALGLSLIIMVVVQFFLPLNFFLLAIFFVMLALFSLSTEGEQEEKVVDFAPLGKLALLGLIFPAIIWGGLFFFSGKIAMASNYFLESLKAANVNDGVRTYDLQIKAIDTDPTVVDYRIAYSQTNFALANSLATKEELSDQDRNTISQLIQQSIREAKAAVAVDPRNVSSWENLANLYRSLINFAEGAEEWTVAAYQQAIALDPANPRLRVDLGGLYYSQKNFQQAANLFAQAANLKPDYANAHYNLANTLREAGDYQGAKREYEVTLSLVQIDSNDYQKVSQELEEVKKLIPSPTPTPAENKPVQPETLITPAPPAEGINPPLELPNEGPEVTPGE